MGFLDNLTKTVSQGIDRAKFEAEKFQRVSRLQGELTELQRQADGKRMECGDRAIDLYRAGQISSPTIGELIAAIDSLRASLIVKEEELKRAQAETFVEPPPAPVASQSQQVPISYEPPRTTAPPSTPPPSAAVPGAATKACPNCQFQMPGTAIFCPNCGARVTS